MPITSLTAVSNVTVPGGFNQWALAVGASKAAAVNSDDSGGGSRLNENSTNQNQLLEWTDLPTAARGGVILQVEQESCARRAGGCTTGRWHHFRRDPVTTVTEQGGTLIPGAGLPCNRQFETLALDPNGGVWTQPQVDIMQFGARSGVVVCTGINLYFMTINVTWTGSSGPQEVDGIIWLGPLIWAGLRGLNLLRESVDQLALFERDVFRLIYRKAGVRTYPALMDRGEREKVLWDLFKQPVYAF